MNAKRCKQLRRQAERLTVGQPSRRIFMVPAKISNPRKVTLGYSNEVAINSRDSTRGVYRALKKEQ